MNEPAILTQAVIGQAVEIALVAVPANMKARIQGLTVCNRSASPSSFRISFSKRGASTSNADYVYYDLPITGNNTFLSELDFSMDGTDVLRAYSVQGNLSITVYGKLT